MKRSPELKFIGFLWYRLQHEAVTEVPEDLASLLMRRFNSGGNRSALRRESGSLRYFQALTHGFLKPSILEHSSLPLIEL
jgi:hypothetical protein